MVKSDNGSSRMTDLTKRVYDAIPDEWVDKETFVSSVVDFVPPGVAVRFAKQKRHSVTPVTDEELVRSGKRGKILAILHSLATLGWIEKKVTGDGFRPNYSLRKANVDASRFDEPIAITDLDVASAQVTHSMVDNKMYIFVTVGDIKMMIPYRAASKLALRIDAQTIVAHRAISHPLHQPALVPTGITEKGLEDNRS